MKEKKGIFLIIIIILIIAILGIIGLYLKTQIELESLEQKYSELEQNEKEENKNENKEENIKANDTYIGIANCFLGSYENGKWYNAQDIEGLQYKDFSIQDIKKFSKFYYHRSEVAEISDYIENEDEPGDLFRFKGPDYESDNEMYNGIHTTNNEKIFTIETEKVEVTNNYDTIIKEIKKENNVTDAETELTTVLKADYDKDGEDETILVVNQKEDENEYANSYKDKDICSLILAVDNDNTYKIVYKYIVTKDENSSFVETQYFIENIQLCDLNQDGKAELCIQAGMWDIPLYSVYEFDGEFKLVLYGEFPW